jgi:hypothetical protein
MSRPALPTAATTWCSTCNGTNVRTGRVAEPLVGGPGQLRQPPLREARIPATQPVEDLRQLMVRLAAQLGQLAHQVRLPLGLLVRADRR